MAEKLLKLHLGVHKTATTYIQNLLKNNLELLSANDIEYIPLDIMRSGLTSKINAFHEKKMIRNLIDQNIKNKNHNILILSDENLLGSPGDVYKHGDFLPATVKRIEYLLGLFNDYRIELHITVRGYYNIYPSNYCEFLRHHHKFVTFKEFVSKFDYLNFSWVDYINNISAIKKHSTLHVTNFEDFIKREDAYFSNLIGTKLELDKNINAGRRKSFNAQTIKMVKIWNKQLDSQYINKFISAIDKVVIASGHISKYDPWNKSETTYLKNKYTEDINVLKKQFLTEL